MAKALEFKVIVNRLDNGDFEPVFTDPWSDPDTPYEMVKLSLLAAEHREHIKKQCIIVNVDLDKHMLMLSEKVIDHEGFYEARKKRKELDSQVKKQTDVDKYQMKLPFEDDDVNTN